MMALTSGLVLYAAPVNAQEIVQQLPSSGPGERLDQSMRILRKNPNDVFALITAGQASLELNDPAMALAHFQRADQLSPGNKDIKVGMGRALVMLERPNDALAYFAEAERLGVPVGVFAADRGFAYDLIGNPTEAQNDYRIAMKTDPNNTVIRRYAISLSISGRPNDAIRLLQPLIQRGDKGALRDEAFVRAMNDDQKGAQQIAQMAMPASTAAQFDPFFRRLPELNAAERARAVHFGDMPVRGTRYASAESGAKPGRVARAGSPDSGLIPEGEPLGTKGKTTKKSTSQSRREAAQAERERKAKEKEDKRVADARAAEEKKRKQQEGKGTGKSDTAPPVRTVRADPVPPPVKVAPMSAPAATPRPSPPPAVVASVPPPSPPPVVVAAASPPPPSPPAAVAVTPPPPPAAVAAVSGAEPASTQIAMASPPPAIPGSGDRSSAVPQGISGPSAPKSSSFMGPVLTEPSGAVTSAAPPPSPPPSSSPVNLVGPGFGQEQPAKTVVTTPSSAAPAPTDLVGSSLGPPVQAGEIVQQLPPPPPPAPVAAPKPTPKPTPKTGASTTSTKDDPKAAASKGKSGTDAKAAGSKTTDSKGSQGKGTASAKDSKNAATTTKGKTTGKEDPKATGKDAKAVGKDAKSGKDTKGGKDTTGKKAAVPERYWLQVATGSDTKALGFDLKRIKSKYSFLSSLGGYTSPFRSSKRLLVGPFKTEAEAKAMESKANKAGLNSFVWVSPAGMEVDPLSK